MTFWVRQHWTNVERRYHTEKDCFALTRAKGEPKQASESEVEAWKLCQWCEGTVSRSNPETDIHDKLLEMNPDDLNAETAGGQS